jgi:Ca2+-binding RTX toxin-like protein
LRKAVLVCTLGAIVTALIQVPASAEISDVAPVTEGSSNPTYFATNHRVAVTEDGRLLVVHGRHSQGVQLRWKNAGSAAWHVTSQGAVTDGMLLAGTGSGDWPSSITVAKGSDGQERAWVVMGDVNYAGSQPVRMRVLTGLDAAGGPTVGPMVIVDNALRGDAFVDVAMERRPGPGGHSRGAIVFVRKVDVNTWHLVVSWFTNTNTTTPSFTGSQTILSSTTGRKQSTLVPTARGSALVVRAEQGEIAMYTHDRDEALTAWHRVASGVAAVARAKPSATSLRNGDVLMAVEDKTVSNHVTVQRFSPGGRVRTVLRMTGYSMPSIASFQSDAWVVMIRDSDGFVVSRHFNPISGWSGVRVEIGAGNGGHHAWPNVLRTTRGFLRFVVRAGSVGSTQSGVKAVERTALVGPDCTQTGTNGADTLTGTAHRDVLCGRGGNDVLIGLAGNDILLGGGGRDTARFPGMAEVTVDLRTGRATGRGHDRLYAVENAGGGNGPDRLTGNGGGNSFWGFGGLDELVGLGAIDLLHGGSGSDTLRGGPGRDTVDGGSGVDRCSFEPGGHRISCERPL